MRLEQEDVKAIDINNGWVRIYLAKDKEVIDLELNERKNFIDTENMIELETDMNNTTWYLDENTRCVVGVKKASDELLIEYGLKDEEDDE